MYLRRHWRQFLLVGGDIFLFYSALWLALTLRQARIVEFGFFLRHIPAFSLLFAAWLATFYALGLYEFRRLRELVSLVGNLLAAAAVSWMLGTTYFYFLFPYLGLPPKTHLLLTLLISHVFALAWRRAWLDLIRSRAFRQEVAFLGHDTLLEELREDLRKDPELGYLPVEGDISKADLVVADAHWVEDNWETVKDVFSGVIRRRVPILHLKDFYESLFGKVLPQYAGHPVGMMEFLVPLGYNPYLLVKRGLDIALSGLLLFLLLPLIGMISIAVRLADGVPVFYGQKRLGLLGREFLMWKFRTMVSHAEAEVPFTSGKEQDPRVTVLGRFLRRFRLDELPQLWNVLRGDMSLVGPRPEWVREVEVLERVIPHYHLRHLVRPGITGWAQVYFRATNNQRDSLEKLGYDLYYVRNISLALDLSILLKTLKRVLLKDALIPSPRPYNLEQIKSGERQAADFGVMIGRN